MDNQKLFDLYKGMVRISKTEDEIAKRYNGAIRKMHTPIHLYNGQEAVAVGVCDNLLKEDMIFTNHRCHGHYLAKGGDLNAMIAELYSKETGCCKGKGGSMHLCDVEAGVSLASAIVAGNVSIATGYALGNLLKKNGNIACVFFGDGASEEGSVYESICFAKLKKLPILYICENNKYAINTPLKDREPCEHVSDKFANILPVSVEYGNDVETVYCTAKKAIDSIRRGDGPCLIEYMTYRTRAHHNVGTGIDEIYRTQEEWNFWKKKDPIEYAKQKLVESCTSYLNKIKEYESNLVIEIEDAFAFAEDSSFPNISQLDKHVWGGREC